MKLFSVVLTDSDKYNNHWSIEKDQYNNDIVLNPSTNQKIKIGKYLVPTLTNVCEGGDIKIKYANGESYSSAVYDFSDDGHYVLNKKNYTITMIKNSDKDDTDYSNTHLMYVTIPTDVTKVVDATVNLEYAEIISTYRNSGMLGAVIRIDASKFPNESDLLSEENSQFDSYYSYYRRNEVKIGEFVLYNQETDTVEKRVIILNRHFSVVLVDRSVITSGRYIEEANKMKERNFYRKLTISPSKEVRTSVYIVSDKKIEEFEKITSKDKAFDDILIIGVDPKIFKYGSEEDKVKFDQVMKDHVLNNKVRAITVVGVKLTKEIYTKYKISICFSHDISSGVIRCVKS